MMTTNDLFQLRATDEIRKLEIQIRYLETLQHNNVAFIENYLEQEKRHLFEKYNINPNLIVYEPIEEQSAIMVAINDYEFVSLEAKETLSQYLIVACYSSFEKSIKKNFKLTGRVNDKTLEHIYRIHKLCIELKKFNIDFDKVSGSKNLNELRIINNLIKHTGIVSEELANLNHSWQSGSIIGDVTTSFNELKHSPSNFLKDLVLKIKLQ